jgi:dynein assembly factor 1
MVALSVQICCSKRDLRSGEAWGRQGDTSIIMEAAVMTPAALPALTPPEEDKYPRITEKFLRSLLKSDMRTYYSTKELNDRLYLHFKGFHCIENLHPFTGLRVLYIEGNCISKIEGLEQCTELRCLFIQENCLKEISGLETLVNLDTLNASDNCLTRISGLNTLKRLGSLLLARNQIGSQGVSDLIDIIGLDNLS